MIVSVCAHVFAGSCGVYSKSICLWTHIQVNVYLCRN